MNHSTRNARLTAPTQFQGADGTTAIVPLGACLIEQIDGDAVDLIWGTSGENAIRLSLDDVKAAADAGSLVLVD